MAEKRGAEAAQLAEVLVAYGNKQIVNDNKLSLAKWLRSFLHFLRLANLVIIITDLSLSNWKEIYFYKQAHYWYMSTITGIRTEHHIWLPAAVINDGLILVWHSVVHPQLTEHVHHEVQEVPSSCSLHHSAEQSEGVGGVQKSGACK